MTHCCHCTDLYSTKTSPRKEVPALDAYSPDTVLAHLARGLVELERMTQAPGTTGLPYPPSLHIGWNRLSRLMLRQGLPIPPSLPALLDLCEQPLPWPGLELGEGAWLPGDRLLANRRVTEACIEIAQTAGDLEQEEQLMKRVLDHCRLRGPELQPSYERFRTFLIERPVLRNIELLDATREREVHPLGDFLKEAYESVPPSCLRDGKVYACKHCGWTVTWHGGEPRCGWQQCPGDRDPRSAVPVAHPSEQLRRLREGLYRYVTVPGLVEQEFLRQVQRLGVKVDLYPDFDSWDFRLHLGGGETWAIDLKDWARPFWLARELRTTRKHRHAQDTRAIIVIPDRRVKECPGYLNVLQNCVEEEQGLEYRSTSKLLAEIRERVGGE